MVEGHRYTRNILAALLSLSLAMSGTPVAAWAEMVDGLDGERQDTPAVVAESADSQAQADGDDVQEAQDSDAVGANDDTDEAAVDELQEDDALEGEASSTEGEDDDPGQLDDPQTADSDAPEGRLPEEDEDSGVTPASEESDVLVTAEEEADAQSVSVEAADAVAAEAEPDDGAADEPEAADEATTVVTEGALDAEGGLDVADADAADADEAGEDPLRAATKADLLNKKLLLKQSASGRCTLASAAMMLRRAAFLNGRKDWAKITEKAIESVAWLGDAGLLFNFTYLDMTVSHATLSNSNESVLRKLLKEHPEGIAIYAPGHTVLLTDYTDGQLWCADPGYGDRRPLSKAYITRATNVTQYWYISSKVEKPLESKPVVTWKRLAGAGRYDTMAAIVKAGWSKTTGGTVLVATGEGFKDALAAAGLAGLEGAPVVLTAGASLSSAAKTQLTRLKPKKVYVVGGPVAVSDKVVKQIKKATGVAPKRIAGATSPATSAALATAGKGRWSDATAIIATNKTFKDALSVAPVAYAKGWPILLASDGASLSKAVLKALKDCGIKQVVIVGGELAVTPHVVDQLKGQGITVKKRLAGKTATGTSLAIAKWAVKNGLSPKGMAFATSQNFPDALAGAAFCGKNKAVLLLADDEAKGNLSFAKTYRTKIKKGYVFGGTAVFSDALFKTLPY